MLSAAVAVHASFFAIAVDKCLRGGPPAVEVIVFLPRCHLRQHYVRAIFAHLSAFFRFAAAKYMLCRRARALSVAADFLHF